jgi:hypothetical protein
MRTCTELVRKAIAVAQTVDKAAIHPRLQQAGTDGAMTTKFSAGKFFMRRLL